MSFLGFPDSNHVQLRAVYLLFVVGCSATYIVGAAARRSYFYAPQIPMLGLVMIRCLSSGERVTTLLGLAVPIYFVVMASLHHEVHTVVVRELELRERNDETNARLVEANTRLTELAMRDPLTGLANRAAFIEHLERAVASARRKDTKIGVLYFDIDRFKVVNDSLGHAVGDELLTDVAHRVTDLLRTNDVLARLGGDEFTICLDGVESVAQAVVVARRIADAFIPPFRVAGRSLNVSASIGVATNYHIDDGAEALLSHADVAQYRAKQNGRNRVEVFDVELRESIQRRVDDEQELRDALALGQIVAYYQPQVDLVTRAIVGAEALARWKHPERGVLAAGAFVPLAEDSGIVFALDAKIIGDAVNARVQLRDQGLDDSFRIWCNISARQLAGRSGGTVDGAARPRRVQPQRDRHRAHRDRGAARRARRGGPHRPGPQARGEGGPRRLRHGALVADVAALARDRRGEDRPLVRAGHHRRQHRRRDRAQRDPARPRPRPERGG